MKRGEHLQPTYLQINPYGKVPTVKIDDFYMTESGAILTFLGDKYDKLVPLAGSKARARYEQLMSFLLTELEQPLWTMAKHRFALQESLRVPDITATAEWEFQKALGVFDALLGDNQYLLPSGFSMVDIVAAQTLAWARNAKQDIASDNIQQYASRVLGREALSKAKSKEKALLPN